MVLLVAVLSMIVIAQAVVLYRLLRELRNAHVNLAAEVGVVRRESAATINTHYAGVRVEFSRAIANCREDTASYLKDAIANTDANIKSLNERLVLLEIEKPQKPKEAEDPLPSRRSYASQKARAEAGARK